MARRHIMESTFRLNLLNPQPVSYTHLDVYKRQVLVIIMLILIMGSMISGILLSNHIFKWIKISGTYMTARQIHMFCAYWGLVVMSLHLGFHWNIAVAMAGRLWKSPSVIRKWVARFVAVVIAGYGLYAFYRRQIGDYLIMRMHFVFYDYEKGIFPFLQMCIRDRS